VDKNVPTTILIADDDPSQLLLTEAALAGAGFVVHTVADGDEAVQRCGEVQPDCVILDVNMPRLSGIDACREIRKQAAGRLVPILMLTGRNDLPAISDAYAAGASDFAQKGMNPRLVVERVRFRSATATCRRNSARAAPSCCSHRASRASATGSSPSTAARCTSRRCSGSS